MRSKTDASRSLIGVAIRSNAIPPSAPYISRIRGTVSAEPSVFPANTAGGPQDPGPRTHTKKNDTPCPRGTMKAQPHLPSGVTGNGSSQVLDSRRTCARRNCSTESATSPAQGVEQNIRAHDNLYHPPLRHPDHGNGSTSPGASSIAHPDTPNTLLTQQGAHSYRDFEDARSRDRRLECSREQSYLEEPPWSSPEAPIFKGLGQPHRLLQMVPRRPIRLLPSTSFVPQPPSSLYSWSSSSCRGFCPRMQSSDRGLSQP